MPRDVVILDGARTAIGTFGGALASVTPTQTAGHVAKAALQRSGVEGSQIGHVVYGHVINTEPRDMYLSRVAAIEAGIPDTTPAMNVNRLCGSGAQAVVSAMQAVALGDADFALAGGAEAMSRSPHAMQTARTGQKMGDTKIVDMMIGALNCPFGTGHMGVTAENVAAEHQIGRDEQDAFALESQRRAGVAQAEGRFTGQIAPLTIKTRKGDIVFDTDEHVKAQTTAEDLAKLRPVFKKDGSVTAGNASGINDGAAAVVLADAETAAARGLAPRARILGYAHAGVRPEVMGLGPIPAVTKLLERTGLSAGDFDVIESNEAFAAQACAVNKGLGLDTGKVNPNGGAIALGHPIGATGAVLVLKCLAELERIEGQKGLITMCIGGGQGIALAVERI
ncbi:MAG: acetyl-CoA C-acyltransferase family protein [Pseudomonadota bacterium]